MERVLKNHQYAQCKVIIEDDEINFVSYRTLVIKATKTDSGEWLVFCTGTYSQTTRKQIGWFLREYFPTLCYYDMKNSAETGECFLARLS